MYSGWVENIYMYAVGCGLFGSIQGVWLSALPRAFQAIWSGGYYYVNSVLSNRSVRKHINLSICPRLLPSCHTRNIAVLCIIEGIAHPTAYLGLGVLQSAARR